MKSSSLIRFLVVVLIIISFGSGYVIGQSPTAPGSIFGTGSPTPQDVEEEFAVFWDIWHHLQTRYLYQPLDNIALTEGAINGMLASLEDPHTRYYSPGDERAEREEFAGQIEGIGIELEIVDGQITIISPLDGSPAQAAGLLPGDVLHQVNGIDLTDMDLEEASELIRGPAGEPVQIRFERNGELLETVITRDNVRVTSVRGEMLEEGIAHIRLSRFGVQTVRELEETISRLMEEQPKGMILDLRRNPGGGLDIVVDIADHFLPKGVVLIEAFGRGRTNALESTDEGLAQDIPLVVLVDEGSASASEVLAGALRDRHRALLVGQTTFGKGTIQTWYPLRNGGGVRITQARWLTPNGTWVQGVGLDPDYFVPLPTPTSGPDSVDTQQQAAIDLLLGKTVESIPSAQGE